MNLGPQPTSPSDFPPLHVREPFQDAAHTHTLIILHGRGSNGPEFASELFSGKLSTGLTIPESLPNWRFVFPSSQERWSTTFEEEEDAWFDIASLTDVERGRGLQIEGLRDSVRYLIALIEDEISKVGGDASRVVLGGISMGMATSLWSLFYHIHTVNGSADGKMNLGGYIGMSGWLPFWSEIEDAISKVQQHPRSSDAILRIAELIASKIDSGHTFSTPIANVRANSDFTIPVFLGHGVDDAFVDVSLGRKVAELLGHGKLGMAVQWKEYEGAELEGHWLKEPEEFDDLVTFLKNLT